MTNPDDEHRDELAALASGVAAHVRRARRRGRRTTDSAAALPAPATTDAGSAAASAPRTAAGSAASTTTAAPAAPAPRSDDAASRTITTAEEVRATAAACQDLESLRAAVASCHACSLCATRTQTVFIDGDGSAGVLFVGEAPGANEDEQGVPFVGRAGKLLTDIITKGMGLDRRRVAIANILKCRPPDNRDPSAEEKRTCTPWLDRQIELLAPRVLIPLGRHATGHILKSDQAMGAMRGRVHELSGGGRVVPTYHPAYLLRSPGQKKACWADIQLAMAEL